MSADIPGLQNERVTVSRMIQIMAPGFSSAAASGAARGFSPRRYTACGQRTSCTTKRVMNGGGRSLTVSSNGAAIASAIFSQTFPLLHFRLCSAACTLSGVWRLEGRAEPKQTNCKSICFLGSPNRSLAPVQPEVFPCHRRLSLFHVL